MSSNQRSLKAYSVLKTRFLAKTAILGVLSFLIMLIETPIPLFAAFLKLDLSDVPALLAGFSMGPGAGLAVELVKNVLHSFRSQTALIGEVANFLTGALLVVPAAWIYSLKKTKKNAILGMIVGTIVMSIGMSIANYYVIIPLYQTVLNLPIDAVVAMGTQANPYIVDLKTLVIFSMLPFNILKGIIVTIITSIVYKKVFPWLHR